MHQLPPCKERAQTHATSYTSGSQTVDYDNPPGGGSHATFAEPIGGGGGGSLLKVSERCK